MKNTFIKQTLFILFIILSFFKVLQADQTTAGSSSIYSTLDGSMQMWQNSGVSSLDSFNEQYYPVSLSYNTQGSIKTNYSEHISYTYSAVVPSLLSCSVTPSTCTPGSFFSFKTIYFDKYTVMPGYPKLILHRDNTSVVGSPFTMSKISGNDPTLGITYSVPVQLNTASNGYTYYFIVYDTYSFYGESVHQTGPLVNTAPVLSYTGQTGYTSDAISPPTGDRQTKFVFNINYKDADNNAPKTGYPRLRLFKSGAELPVSPVVMNYVSGVYNTNALYTVTVSTLSLGTDYKYFIETYDAWGSSCATSLLAGPSIYNNPPSLSWTGTQGYINSGVSPNAGDTATVFDFRIKYTDSDNDPPSAVKLNILKSGVLTTSATMWLLSNGVYQSTMTLTAGTSYYFKAYDIYGATADTHILSGPLISSHNPKILNAKLNYSVGTTTYTYTYTLVYYHPDGTLPKAGCPKLSANTGSGTLFIATMTYLNGNISNGATYFYSVVLSTPNKNYAWQIDAQDLYGWQAASLTGTGPQVSGYAPVLNFVGGYPSYVKPNTPFTINMAYSDKDQDTPKAGYPRVRFYLNGNQILNSSMNYVSGGFDNALYSFTTQLSSKSAGYSYKFEACDKFCFGGVIKSSATSLIVAYPPPAPVIDKDSVKDGDTAASGRVRFAWASTDSDATDAISYRFYMSTPSLSVSASPHRSTKLASPNSLQLVYTGTAPSYTAYSLTSGAVYWWRVDAVNSYGVVTSGQVNTLYILGLDNGSNKTFNYPNPFNPVREKTHIVFPSRDNSVAVFHVYSEDAVQKYSTTFNAVTGTNDFLYDGRDKNGAVLNNGTYIFVVEASGHVLKNVLLIVK